VVAANLALGVVAPYLCGYGGDLLAMVWDGRVHACQSVGRSAAAATPAPDPGGTMPTLGPHAVTVPGAVAGWFELLDRFGTRTFGDLSRAAVRLARDGFELSAPGADRLSTSLDILAGFAPDPADLIAAYPQVAPGDRVVQPALAHTIETLAADGPDAYYRGPIGAAIAETVQRHGGSLAAADLTAHSAEWVAPLMGTFRDVEILQMPPPTQGVTALEMLAIANGLDIGDDSVDRLHLLIETARLALEDRDQHVGDPDVMKLGPSWLFSPEHIRERRALIDPARAGGTQPRPAADGGTAYMCAADGDGMMVSLIQSNFLAIGSGVHVPEWGINLQNRGSSFSLEGGHVNELAPSKLPMHTLIPALVLRDGEPALVFGTMGGHTQAQIHLQVLVRHLVDGNDPQDAVAAPRFSVDPGSATVHLESRFPARWADDLHRRGHDVHAFRAFDDGAGHAHAIQPTPHGYLAGADPRAESVAAGV
jgi:gamma-glutamyltranspeptidase/glutathione hydrolase